MPDSPGGPLTLVSPSDNAWRSKNYNMLIKDQRFLSEMASMMEEGTEWDTATPVPRSAFRAASAAGLLDNPTLEKLGLGHLILSTASGETLKSAYSSSLLIDTKSIQSGEESSSFFGRRLSSSEQENGMEYEGFVIPPEKLAKALRLLNVPPISTEFENEEEMLQVYQLIYDALRYRIVFDQTLDALDFFDRFPKWKPHERIVHLLFFDLQQRYFQSRDNHPSSKTKYGDLSEMLFSSFEEKDTDFVNMVKDIETELWELRLHLAASVARLRIKRHAFYLINLLPEHLRGPSHLDGSAKRALSFWINNFLIREEAINEIFRDSGLQMVDGNFVLPRSSSIENIGDMSYFYDKACKNLIFCNPFLRDAITHSQLVKENYLVIQDRSFCLGPSLLCQRLSEWGINGAVVQTHISSVRVTAYLATLLNEFKPKLAIKPEVVLAFGAGDRKNEYEASLKAMGIKNVIVYSEPWISIATTVIQALVDASETYEATYPNVAISPDFTYSCIPIPIDMEEMFEQLDNVVAVYATPPNTYSAVPDPVELAVSRGGDMKLLEDVTRNMAAKYEIAYEDILRSNESKEDQEYLLEMMEKERKKEEEEEREKLMKLNMEQWEVLSLCLSLPQIQVVVYETHSTKSSENKELVQSAVDAANNAAVANLKKYLEEKEASQKGDLEQDEHDETSAEVPELSHNDNKPDVETKLLSLENGVPLTDLFEVEDIPLMKETSKEDGCSISLIKRKEFVLLNNRYLIQMAEARGLFGKKVEDKAKSPSESAKGGKRKRKGRTMSGESDNSADFRPVHRNKQLELERISAPTVASLRRSRKWSSKKYFKDSKDTDDGNSSEDDYDTYACSRCASRGEDECLHQLKMEGGRVIHPNKLDENMDKKKKTSVNNFIDVKFKGQLTKKPSPHNYVSVLFSKAKRNEPQSKTQNEESLNDPEGCTEKSSAYKSTSCAPIEKQKRKTSLEDPTRVDTISSRAIGTNDCDDTDIGSEALTPKAQFEEFKRNKFGSEKGGIPMTTPKDKTTKSLPKESFRKCSCVSANQSSRVNYPMSKDTKVNEKPHSSSICMGSASKDGNSVSKGNDGVETTLPLQEIRKKSWVENEILKTEERIKSNHGTKGKIHSFVDDRKGKTSDLDRDSFELCKSKGIHVKDMQSIDVTSLSYLKSITERHNSSDCQVKEQNSVETERKRKLYPLKSTLIKFHHSEKNEPS